MPIVRAILIERLETPETETMADGGLDCSLCRTDAISACCSEGTDQQTWLPNVVFACAAVHLI